MFKYIREFDIEKFKEYCLVLGYFTSLFSTTCFFFDPHKIQILGTTVQLPIGLTFFPLTFALSNIIQDKFGRVNANCLVITAFAFDTILVFGGVLLANMGDRTDYLNIFTDMSHIMVYTWLFLGVGSIFNLILYSYLNKDEPKNIYSMLMRFFITITATETLTSIMSMPLMFYRHGLQGSIMLTIIIIVAYKVLANIIITMVYYLFIKRA